MATRLVSLVIDSAEPRSLGRWWADAIGWPVTVDEPDEVVVEPSEDNATVPALVFVPVPEDRTTKEPSRQARRPINTASLRQATPGEDRRGDVDGRPIRSSPKNRIHLDLASTSEEHQGRMVDRLLDLGATRADIGQSDVPWIVLADPEGNEFCVLEPRERYMTRGPIAAIVVDAAEPAALARFWEAASGWRIGFESEPVVSMHPSDGRLPDLDFVSVADSRTVKNRVHLDVAPFPDDLHDAEVARLVGLGAQSADVGQGPDVTWVVLTDPEGNEFCVLSPR